MKYICLGYIDEQRWETVPERERRALLDECVAYDADLRKHGHFVAGEALQSAHNAVTLRFQSTTKKVSVTDGPFVESKELLGGILVLEARDLNEAIQLVSRHPGLRVGGFEIRPAEDLAELTRAGGVRSVPAPRGAGR